MHRRSDSFKGRAKEVFLKLEAMEPFDSLLVDVIMREMPRLKVTSDENDGSDAFVVMIDFDGQLRILDAIDRGPPRFSPGGIKRLLHFINGTYEDGLPGHQGWDE